MNDWFTAAPDWVLGIAAVLLLIGAAEGGDAQYTARSCRGSSARAGDPSQSSYGTVA